MAWPLFIRLPASPVVWSNAKCVLSLIFCSFVLFFSSNSFYLFIISDDCIVWSLNWKMVNVLQCIVISIDCFTQGISVIFCLIYETNSVDVEQPCFIDCVLGYRSTYLNMVDLLIVISAFFISFVHQSNWKFP